MSTDEAIKICVVGKGGVGKSAMTLRFVRDGWVDYYDPTFADSYTKLVELDGEVVQVEVLDTAGQEAYEALQDQWFVAGHGFILVYSIVDDQTLDDLHDIRDRILEANPNPEVPMILVGNKLDLKDDRIVSYSEGKALAQSFDTHFSEISAKDNVGVTNAFEEIIRRVIQADPDLVASSAAGKGSVFGAGVVQTRTDTEEVDVDKNVPGQPKALVGGGCECAIS
mmetsp:Transcript_38128/g.51593  ORF Transcript_38128/g.51593 Transcript_38128/m.51593 type:complete len:224 (-) Transcript_38128:182-853(-)